MAILATNKPSKSFEPIDAGSYMARIYQLIHIGTVPGYQGTLQNKVRIGFEFPTELELFDKEKGEQPRVISKEYTLSFNEKSNLRKVIDACVPDAFKVQEDGFCEVFDIETLIGKTCLVSVKNDVNQKGYKTAYIDTTTVPPKGMVCPDQINPSYILNYEEKWNQQKFDKLPDFLKDMMKTSNEYKIMTGLISTPMPDIDFSDIGVDDLPPDF